MELRAAQGGLEGDRRHRARPDRPDRRARRRTSTSRSARPAAARRGSTRSRSSTAGSCSRRPRSTAPTARTRSPTTPAVGRSCCCPRSRWSSGCSPTRASSIYACGRNDIATGQIDRRVLAVLEYLVAKGYHLTITSLKCGHSYLTASGNVSEHSTGDAVDIAAINGVPVTGHQGPGTLTDELIKRLLQLQGTMRPHQVISLRTSGQPASPCPTTTTTSTSATASRPEAARSSSSADPEARPVAAPDPAPRADREPEGPVEAVRRRTAGEGREQPRRRLAAVPGPRPSLRSREPPSSSWSWRARSAWRRAATWCGRTTPSGS